MRLHKMRHIIPLLLLVCIGLTVGCSTQKNTAKSRWWHSFNARYNTYYNGTLAYIDGSEEKEKGNKDNFTEILPLYTVGNKKSRELGKGNFDKAIEKSQKAIKLHSIKKRPEWTKKRRKTEKDLEWLNRKEYNPMLWKAWMLMGRSQFHQGAFDEAASTFAYMGRLYQTQPAIYGRARAWLAKCYIEQDWIYDAEDVIRNMRRDSIHWSAQKEWDYTYADYFIHIGDYEQAIPYLRKVIKHEMRKKQKAREWYLMGQLENALGHREAAYKAYKRVGRLNPPYEVAFNAKIAMTEVMAEGQWKKMISQLKRMARSDNNKEYLDQVYYAIGNIYLSQKDTLKAISAYETGNQKATRSGIEKGVLLLKLGDIYWELEKFSDAQRCYGEAIGLLDKERKDYEQLSQRSKILDELAPYTDAVHLQDSLQALAKMDEKERNEAIDRVIEALKKKEKEEKKLQAEANAQQVMQRNGAIGNRNNTQNNTPTPQTGTQQNGKWYFYNPMAVQQGKQSFEKLWGKRENVDNWQRVNKTVVAGVGSEEFPEMTQEQLDSIAKEEAIQDSLEQVKDSAQNDPHKREYYLAQIPFTEEQLLASNLILEDGLFNSGVIFKDKLNNLPLSEKALRRLTDEYPDFENMDAVYYHLFLLYNRMNMPAIADGYIEKLKENFPESQWTGILSDPYFKENAIFGEHMEDSLYAATYNAFKDNRYDEVKSNSRISEERFPLGANRDKFLFINGLGKLNDGDGDGCLADMNTIVEKFPQSKLAEMAGMIVNGVKAGKQLYGGKFDLGDVWSRRSVVLSDSDSINAKKLSPERNIDFLFMVVYKPDSVNENQLLYELARYNFTSYMVRNFDITIEQDELGLHHMQVSGFRNYDEALQYARELYQQANIVKRLGKSRSIVISTENLPLLGKQFSYDDYDEFYTKHFAPLKVSTFDLLSEPAELGYDKEDDIPMPTTEEEVDKALDDMFIDSGGGNGGAVNNQEDNIVIEEETNKQGNNTNVDEGTTIIDEPVKTNNNRVNEEVDNNIIIEEPVKKQQQVEDDNEIIIEDNPVNKQVINDDSDVIIIEDTNNKKQQQESDDYIIIEDTNNKKQQQTEDVIIIDDEPDLKTNNKQKKQEVKEDSIDIEDEYYDLGGF
ncbi:MAG: hypothetical protein II100_03845 [Prevotella sp.]|nr:hypothetical protein [Prevotella sp.]MBQ1667266.1 hypothetical protein [Prevotella sp.]